MTTRMRCGHTADPGVAFGCSFFKQPRCSLSVSSTSAVRMVGGAALGELPP